MSQMQLAEKVGVSYQQIQKYEKGRSELTISRLYQISEALGVDPLGLLPSRDTMIAEPRPFYGGVLQEEIELLTLFRKIRDKKMKESFVTILKGTARIQKKKA